MDLSIIIINWRSKDFLRECLDSIHAMESETPTEIIVVDNNSGDGVAQMLTAEFPEVRFVQARENLGLPGATTWARGKRAGIYSSS